MILATDPDADRLALAEKQPEYVARYHNHIFQHIVLVNLVALCKQVLALDQTSVINLKLVLFSCHRGCK